jgi:biopolymer transport protein ExbB
MIDLFFKGGPLMYPLLLCSIAMLAIIVERGIVFSRTGIKKGFILTIMEYVRDGNIETAFTASGGKKGPVQSLVKDILERRNSPKDVLEHEISLRGDRILHKLRINLHLLSLIGRIAPMLGLLGTVMGMVKAFQKIASVSAVPDPSLLAGGIWEALITTVFGLVVGIPALVANHLYVSRVHRIAFQMKHTGEELLSLIKNDQF